MSLCCHISIKNLKKHWIWTSLQRKICSIFSECKVHSAGASDSASVTNQSFALQIRHKKVRSDAGSRANGHISTQRPLNFNVLTERDKEQNWGEERKETGKPMIMEERVWAYLLQTDRGAKERGDRERKWENLLTHTFTHITWTPSCRCEDIGYIE